MIDPQYNSLLAEQVKAVDIELFLNEIAAWQAEDLADIVTQTIDSVVDIFFESCDFEVFV